MSDHVDPSSDTEMGHDRGPKMEAAIEKSTAPLKRADEWHRRNAAAEERVALIMTDQEQQAEMTRLQQRSQQNAERMAERARRVIGIIEDNPDRVEADKPSAMYRDTVYDPDKAQVMAQVVDPDMTIIAEEKKKGRYGRRREAAELSRRQYEDAASAAYDRNPDVKAEQIRKPSRSFWSRITGRK